MLYFRYCIIVCALLFAPAFANAQYFSTLMPVPSSIKFSSEKFRLTESFSVRVSGASSSMLHKAIVRAMDRFVGRTGLFLSTDYKTNRSVQNAAFAIVTSHIGELRVGEDESYTLEVTRDSIILRSVTDIGALRGLETLLQLQTADREGYYIQGCSISDKPRFVWRGLMIDVARHYMPMDVLFRNIDGMAAVKINVLHLHLSDNQGFRVECKTFPKLHERGSDGFFYSHEQIREILHYANDRGIRVVPEFDMPAHSTSWFVGYPELASLPASYAIERSWGVFDPVMDPTKESTYLFLDGVLKEMTALFNDEYFHIGGDENTGKQWDANPEIMKFKIEKNIPSNNALQNIFIQRVSDMLTKYNKKIIGWEEILQNGTLKSTVLQTWREDVSLRNALNKGYQVLVSRGYYIDLMYSAEHHYGNDPFPVGEGLTESQEALILGGEATIWSEFVTPENIDSRIWPRTAAIAERFWSPQKIRDVNNMYQRLATVSFRLEELGLLHKKNYDMMIRRIVNNGDEHALRAMLDVIEPLEEYNRFDKGKEFTSYSSYSRTMDVAISDAPMKRTVRSLVERYLATKNASAHDSLITIFTMWKENHAKFLRTQEQAPILSEMQSLSTDLEIVGTIGLKCLSAIEAKKNIDKVLYATMSEQLVQAALQRGQCELVIIEPVKQLLLRASKR